MLLFNLLPRDKDTDTFPKGISPKVNVIKQIEFELAYYDVAVMHSRHYNTQAPHYG